MLNNLRNRLDSDWFAFTKISRTKGLMYAASIVVFSAGLAAELNWISSAAALRLIAFLGLLFALYQIIADYILAESVSFKTSTDFQTILKTILPSQLEAASHFSIIRDPSPVCNWAICRSELLDAKLRAGTYNPKLRASEDLRRAFYARIREDPICFLALRAKAVSASSSGADFFNEAKISIASPILGTAEDCKEISVFKGCYYLSFLTNELSYTDIYRQSGSRTKRIHRASFPTEFTGAHEVPRLEPLGGFRRLSSHLGVNVVAHSKDGYLCFWQQAGRALHARDSLAPTGSGSCDWADLTPRDEPELIPTVEAAMHREFMEESFSQSLPETLEVEIRVIGFCRNLARGGLPAFHGLLKLGCSAQLLMPNVAEVVELEDHQIRMQYPARTLKELNSVVNDLLGSSFISVALRAHLLCLQDALKTDADAVSSFLRLETT